MKVQPAAQATDTSSQAWRGNLDHLDVILPVLRHSESPYNEVASQARAVLMPTIGRYVEPEGGLEQVGLSAQSRIRSAIPLPRNNPADEAVATAIVSEILERVKRNDISVEPLILGSQPANTPRLRFDVIAPFIQEIGLPIVKTLEPSESKVRAEIQGLVIAVLLEKGGLLRSLPPDLFSSDVGPGSEEWQRTGAFLRYFFKPLQSYRDVETSFGSEAVPEEARRVLNLTGFELATVAWPRIFAGESPLGRPWLMSNSEPHKGDRATPVLFWSAGWLVSFGTGCYDPKSGKFDQDKLLRIKWSMVADTQGIERKPEHRFGNVLNLVDFGLRANGLPGVGTGANQIEPWKFRWGGKWVETSIRGSGEIGLIDDLCKDVFLVQAPPEHPKRTDSEGFFKPRTIIGVDWHDGYFEAACEGSLTASSTTVPIVLSKNFPHYFGYGKELVRPEEIPARGMWGGDPGKLMFRSSAAYLASSQCGLGKVDEILEYFVLNREDFKAWISQRVQTVDRSGSPNRDFLDVLRQDIGGGFQTIAKSSLTRAMSMVLLGADNASGALKRGPPREGMSLLQEAMPERVVIILRPQLASLTDAGVVAVMTTPFQRWTSSPSLSRTESLRTSIAELRPLLNHSIPLLQTRTPADIGDWHMALRHLYQVSWQEMRGYAPSVELLLRFTYKHMVDSVGLPTGPRLEVKNALKLFCCNISYGSNEGPPVWNPQKAYRLLGGILKRADLVATKWQTDSPPVPVVALGLAVSHLFGMIRQLR